MDKVLKGTGSLSWDVSVEEYSELVEVGCTDSVKVVLSIREVGESFLLEGDASGSLNYECNRCGAPRKGPFGIKIKILIELSKEPGIRWLEDEVEEFDNYIIEVGLREPEFSIISIIREQILLNCNLANPEDEVLLEECFVCGVSHLNKEISQEEKPTTDPRWDALKDLL